MTDGVVVLISLMRAVVEVAGMCLLGQGVLGLLAGSRRHNNPIYRAFGVVTRPAVALMRCLLPARVGEAAVTVFAFGALFVLWIGLAYLRLSVQRAG